MKEKNLEKNKQHLFEGVTYAHLLEFIDKFELTLGENDEGKFDLLGYNQEAIREKIGHMEGPKHTQEDDEELDKEENEENEDEQI